jgi:predicted AAA+ superfamily ATPase
MLVDRHGRRFEFFLTGSSARQLRARAANLLAGRAHAFRLAPVLSLERAGTHDSAVLGLPAQGASSTFPDAPIADRLVWGGLPGVVLESPAGRRLTLETYAEVYLEEEIRREGLVRDVGAFARFLELAALESGRVMNLTGLSQESGIAVSTLRTYYDVLVDTFIGDWIRPYGRRGRKQILATPRFVFFDTGVRNAAARLPLGADLLRTQGPELFEQWAVAELVHRATYLGRAYRVSFWRTRHGAEVDIVLETPRRDLPVEVKWTENPRSTDARHVERFLDTYPERAREGFVVCRCAKPRRLTERVTAIPWQML